MYAQVPAIAYAPACPVAGACAWARVATAIAIAAQLALLARGVPPSDILEMLPEPSEGQWELAA